jgi:hypothetical protein
MKKKKKIALIMIGLILSLYFSYKVYERWPTENWKMYDDLISLWPRLKSEGIENIKYCWIYNPQTNFRGSSCDDIKGMLGFRVMDVNVVKWWTIYKEVPKECLPECINILDKTMKGMWWKWLSDEIAPAPSSSKMLIVTKKGKYIVHAGIDFSSVYRKSWDSHKLKEYFDKCGLIDGRRFVPPKEQIVSIVIFPPPEDIRPRHSHLLDYNPVALFGDKKITEKLFGKTLEPKMIFEGRDKLEKIVDEYNSASKEGKILSDQYFLIFVTQDWFYWKDIYLDANAVYGSYTH